MRIPGWSELAPSERDQWERLLMQVFGIGNGAYGAEVLRKAALELLTDEIKLTKQISDEHNQLRRSKGNNDETVRQVHRIGDGIHR